MEQNWSSPPTENGAIFHTARGLHLHPISCTLGAKKVQCRSDNMTPIIWADEERIKKDPQKTNEMMANRRCNFRNGKVLRSFSIWQGVNGSNAACSLTLWQNMLMAWKCMQNKIAYIVKNETQNQVWYPCRSPILSTFCGNAIFFYVRSRLSNLFYCHVRERDCGRLRAENIASHCPKLRLFTITHIILKFVKFRLCLSLRILSLIFWPILYVVSLTCIFFSNLENTYHLILCKFTAPEH